MSINIALLIMVVICFHFSIFEPLETAAGRRTDEESKL